MIKVPKTGRALHWILSTIFINDINRITYVLRNIQKPVVSVMPWVTDMI